ncbi:hypothetical protein P691DRAFT_786548 [Macrolepiota fuliginosa MF-IS2]|uniref:Uncharacterized protein n=1 Tax=Macrolepiota fuliginosa MF-IS2 TaxID=1400762 RepID=A0A9P5X5P5_9AGAR|nr:hypothetical protein P691DRAFT_786548 [Macrolepiota fuliginosa MF-IS2]
MEQLKKLGRLFLGKSESPKERDRRGEYSAVPVRRPRLPQTQRSAQGSANMSNTASASRRQSIINQPKFGSQNKPSPRSKRSTAEDVILEQSERKKSRVTRRDEQLQQLQAEQERLVQQHSGQLFISESKGHKDRDKRGEYSAAPVRRPRLSQAQRSALWFTDMSDTASPFYRQSVSNPLMFGSIGSQDKSSLRQKRTTPGGVILRQSERRKSRVA